MCLPAYYSLFFLQLYDFYPVYLLIENSLCLYHGPRLSNIFICLWTDVYPVVNINLLTKIQVFNEL